MNNFAWAIAGLAVSLIFVVLAFTSSKIKVGGMGTRIAGLQKVFTRPLAIGLAVAVSLGIVAYWGLYTSLIPRPGDVGSWSWHHWLPLLVFLAIVGLTIEFTVKKEQSKKTLQKTLMRVVFMLFVGFPMGMWIASGLGITTSPQRASCAAFGSSETHSCVLTEDWSLPITTYERTYAGEYNFCVVAPRPDAYESKKVGLNTFELRSHRGMLPIQYRLVAGACPNKF